MRASALTALPFALFHMPVNVVEGGWGFALVFLPIQTVLFVFVARADHLVLQRQR